MQIAFFIHPVSMKMAIITAVLFFTAVWLYAQPAPDTLYAYRQRVSPGTQKIGDLDENGKLIKKEAKPVFHYAIYLISSSKTPVYPVQLWINGEAAAVEVKTLASPPIMYTNVDAPTAVPKPLFAPPNGTIFQLTPTPLTTDKDKGEAKTLAKNNAVVLLYKKEGKLQYGVLRKFTDLPAVSLQ
jgi:hypothetical protein